MASIDVKFTGPAQKEIAAMSPDDFGGKNPEQWHIDKVKEFAATNAASLPGVTVGRVRKAAHSGGTDPSEADHITVTYRAKNKDIPSAQGGGWHVYTGR